MGDLTNVEAHFRFGENWKNYLRQVDDTAIREAELGLLKLIPSGRLIGSRFLDIGCGSGLHALAAERLGAASVTAMDIDADSIAATRQLFGRYAPESGAVIRRQSVFDASGQFDVVYSWGVLHHTGAMWRAVEIAASLVKPGGLFALALYQKTPSCGMWKRIKRAYSGSPKLVQTLIRGPYMLALLGRVAISGRNPLRYVRNYTSSRGMNFFTDVHDWLGGYPYESASPEEVISFLNARGFRLIHDGSLPLGVGIFGTGCAEFVFEKI